MLSALPVLIFLLFAYGEKIIIHRKNTSFVIHSRSDRINDKICIVWIMLLQPTNNLLQNGINFAILFVILFHCPPSPSWMVPMISSRVTVSPGVGWVFIMGGLLLCALLAHPALFWSFISYRLRMNPLTADSYPEPTQSVVMVVLDDVGDFLFSCSVHGRPSYPVPYKTEYIPR
nr:MAG TPA: hypothetical protein [Caudoviricetes sp.]